MDGSDVAILKGTSRQGAGVPLDLSDLAARGEMIVRRAQEHAERILREAQHERERLIASAEAEGRAAGERQGYAAGLARGREEGRKIAEKEARDEIASAIRVIASAGKALEEARTRLIAEAGDELLSLAIAIASAIARRALRVDPTLVVDTVRDALEQVGSAQLVSISLHPDDDAVVRTTMPELISSLRERCRVEFRHDRSLERGSCVVRGDLGVLADATLATKIERIAREILPDQPRAQVAA